MDEKQIANALPNTAWAVCYGEPHHPMAHILLAVYLILVGLRILVDLNLPAWITGVLALATGILLIAQRFGITTNRK